MWLWVAVVALCAATELRSEKTYKLPFRAKHIM